MNEMQNTTDAMKSDIDGIRNKMGHLRTTSTDAAADHDQNARSHQVVAFFKDRVEF